MRAVAVFAFMASTAAVAVTVSPTPAPADYCEPAGCSRECWAIPGGQRCKTTCRRHCWPAPSPYVPPAREYEAPRQYYAAPRYHSAVDPTVPIGAGVLLLIVIGLIAALSESEPSIDTAIEEAEQLAADAAAHARDAALKTEEIDAFIKRAKRAARARGARQSDEEFHD